MNKNVEHFHLRQLRYKFEMAIMKLFIITPVLLRQENGVRDNARFHKPAENQQFKLACSHNFHLPVNQSDKK